jgi:hypothetical protein
MFLRLGTIAFLVAALCGCGNDTARMDHPDDPQGPFREQITAARQLLEQKEDWSDRVEWEVRKSADGWQVIAWRIEHPDRQGAERYLPWGYSVIDLDSRDVAVHYRKVG